MEIELVEWDDGKPYSRWCVDTAVISLVPRRCRTAAELTQTRDGRRVRPGGAHNVLDNAGEVDSEADNKDHSGVSHGTT
jgi:hypothetical protein